MSYIKRAISLALVIALCVCFVGCDNSEETKVYFGLDKDELPTTVDPQAASTDAELMLVRNMFEGLLRKNSKGEIVNGACSSYEKSGNTYTFTLRSGIKWSDGSKLTAEDFVYGIRRAVDPATASPLASRLFSVKNAKSINEGVMSVQRLGVTASGNKVIIITENESNDFLSSLTCAAAMPCKEKFFIGTDGMYGQDAENIISNGSYRMAKWNREEFGIRLYRFEDYNGDFYAKNGGVFFSCQTEEKDNNTQLVRLNKGSIDAAFIPPEDLADAKKQDFKIKSVENICWVMTIGNCYSREVRECLALAMTTTVYKDELPTGFRPAKSIFPAVLSVNGAENVGLTQYDIETAKMRFSKIVSDLPDKKFPSPTLYYYDVYGIKDAVTAAVANWQQNLSAFVNIHESTSLNSLQKELSEKSLEMAVFPIYAKNDSVSDYLRNFGVDGDAVTAQQIILSDKTVIPFAFASTNLCYSEKLGKTYCDSGDGFIDFSFIIKSK